MFYMCSRFNDYLKDKCEYTPACSHSLISTKALKHGAAQEEGLISVFVHGIGFISSVFWLSTRAWQSYVSSEIINRRCTSDK